MNDDNNIYISGYTMPHTEEVDDESIEYKITSAENNYDAHNFLDSFDTDDFEVSYRINIPLIIQFSASDIITICKILMMKTEHLYSYKITPTPVFSDMNDVMSFFDFIKFLQYDNISFISDMCVEMGKNKKDISQMKNFEKENKSKMIDIVDNISSRYKYNNYIYEYLINQSKNEMIDWLNKSFVSAKPDIILELN